MRHNTWLPVEFKDLVIGVLALAFAMVVWAVLFAPAVV
jgi:hypothetical protein